MHHRAFAAAVCVAVALGLGIPAQAFASGDWGWPVDGPVIAGYGTRYTSQQGTSCTHGGVDIKASAGSTVHACSGGEVVFSGLVPAGEGERAWAVTVLTADGLRVTYLPLERAFVSKGAAVHADTGLGELAAGGDASSSTSHLHLGVRRGETRLDPMSFLAERESKAAPSPAPAPVSPTPKPSGGAPVSPPVAKPVPHVSSAPVQASAPVRAPAPAASAVTGRASVTVPAGAAARSLPSQSLALLPHASLPELPVLTRVPLLSTATRVRTAAVTADVASARDFLAGMLARLALVGLAGACAWPALRSVLDGRASSAPAAVAVRSDGA